MSVDKIKKYDSGYQKSQDVIASEQKKNEATDAVTNYEDFAYSKVTPYNDIMDKILNREKFSYDLNGDALYQQYKDKYIQQGKMAMQDTMGQAAAMTGGYGNSYAATVGNQAYQASLGNLNDVIPELYQLAYDKYRQEGQDLYNQYGMLSDDRNMEYGMWGDKHNKLVADRDYYTNEANNAYSKDYGEWSDNRAYDTNQYWKETEFTYGKDRDKIEDEQWQKSFDEGVRQIGGSGNDDGGFNTSGILTYAGLDDNGRAVYYDEDGKSRTYEVGINPYTGTKNKDAKNGTFSNGYQPDNINGEKLKNSGMSTSVTGKNQTIWECGGKYWVWYGKQNKYVEVDVED